MREWRTIRQLSQLDLALSADVSARHVSYVETGKAQLSREMVERFGEVLRLPLRELNALRVAAGYAPDVAETVLSEPDQANIQLAIDSLLNHHEPYPAFVVSRHWDVLTSNRGAQRVFDFVMDGRPSAYRNIIRQVFDPDDMRSVTANWEELAGELIRHVHAAIANNPADPVPRALLEEALAFPGVPPHWRARDFAAELSPFLTTVFRKNGRELRFLSTFTMFGFARNITLQDQHVECCFPMDDATAALCHALRDKEAAKAAGDIGADA